jgi:hypothetical protein
MKGLSVPDEAIYRCIQASCGKALPRKVNYCPYCGTAQHAAAAASAPIPAHAQIHAKDARTSAQAFTLPASGDRPGPDIGPKPAEPLSPKWGTSSPAASVPAVPSGRKPSGAAPVRSAGAQSRPARANGSGPPQREPIRLRWWLLALAALWMVWFMAKPSSKKIEARIDHAIALATDCKSREAQTELIELRAARATPGQLQRLQDALNDAAAQCKRQRNGRRVSSDAGSNGAPMPGELDDVGSHVSSGRQGTTRPHPRADGEP